LSKMLIDFSEVAAKSMSGTTSATSSITFSIDAPAKQSYRGFYKAEMPDRGADGAPPTDEPRVRSSAYRS
jgi:hypothetical protein